ncbi:MAG: 4Fe-4S dicluster domain-containing protein [bacterium]
MKAPRPSPLAKAILTDVTRCVGCEKCVVACEKTWNTGDTIPSAHAAPDGLSGARWTAIVKIADRFVRKQCLHCINPACLNACPVHAFERLPEGPVIYNKDKCIGCRYCMISCPFTIPRYEWNTPVPFVRKCKFCFERLAKGERPACTAACPYGATIFGTRKEMLAEAQYRLAMNPRRYIQRIWGETDYGGTSVLYISDVPLEALGFPADDAAACKKTFSAFTWPTALKTPYLGGTVLAGTAAVGWIINRRMEIAEQNRKQHESGQSENRDSKQVK